MAQSQAVRGLEQTAKARKLNAAGRARLRELREDEGLSRREALHHGELDGHRRRRGVLLLAEGREEVLGERAHEKHSGSNAASRSSMRSSSSTESTVPIKT